MDRRSHRFDTGKNNKEAEIERQQRAEVEIPLYNPDTQLQIVNEVPAEYQKTYGQDPGLYTIAVEVTRARRHITRETQQGNTTWTGSKGLKWVLDNLDKRIGRQYDTHGIAGKYHDVSEMDKMLRDGIDSEHGLYSMSLINAEEATGAFGASHPFTTGGVFMVAESGGTLLKNGIRYMILGEEFAQVIDIIRARYPEITVLSWNEAPAVLIQNAEPVEGPPVVTPVIDPENPPHYSAPVPLPMMRRAPQSKDFIPTEQPPSPKPATQNDDWDF